MSTDPHCGVIVFNKQLETIVVEPFDGENNFSFPNGRKNSFEESDEECALRGLEKETGLTNNNILLLNDGKLFGTEKIKKYQIRYFIALFTCDKSVNFTFNDKELKCSPYWATYELVKTKFYNVDRLRIYEEAYEYMKKYLGKDNSSVKQFISPPSKPNISWASVAGNNILQTPPITFEISTPPTPIKVKQNPTIITKTSNLSNDNCIRIGKTLSWMLRHGVKECNLTMREDAYVPLSEVLSQKQMNGVKEEDILHIVNTNSKKRYEVTIENNVKFIRATQGHSKSIGDEIDQEQLLKVITVPYEKCIHGTDKKSWKLIEKTGLKRMERKHIHLINSEPSDKTVISGARSSSTVLVYIDMARAMADGITFYLSSNGVILTEGIDGTLDPKYIINVVFRK